MELHPTQLNAVELVKRGKNTIITAVAGSGKSTTLRAMVREVYRDRDVLVVMFQKQAQEDFTRKLVQDLGKGHGVEVSTTYSLGLKLLKGHSKHSVLEGKKTYMIASNFGKRFKAKLRDDEKLLYGTDGSEFTKNLVAAINLCRLTNSVTFESAMDLLTTKGNFTHFDQNICTLVLDCIKESNRWFDEGDKNGVYTYDFADMVYQPLRLGLYSDVTYDTIMVDEAQDLNQCQIYVVEAYSHTETQIVAVGDNRQAIYAFAGATSNSMKELERIATDWEYTTIPVSFRCPKKVALEAQKYVPYFVVPDTAKEGFVSHWNYEKMLQEVKPGDVILGRMTKDIIDVATTLLSLGKQVIVLGVDLLGSILSLIQELETRFHLTEVNFETIVQDFITEKINLLSDIDGAEEEILKLKETLNIILMLWQRRPNIARSLNQFKIFIGELSNEKRKDVIILMTIHKSKGLEFNRVFIINHMSLPMKNQNMTPEQLEQEENLVYVAYTRSTNTLIFIPVIGAVSNNLEVTETTGNTIDYLAEVEWEVPPAIAAVSILNKTSHYGKMYPNEVRNFIKTTHQEFARRFGDSEYQRLLSK